MAFLYSPCVFETPPERWGGGGGGIKEKEKAGKAKKFLFSSLPLGSEFIPVTNSIHRQDKDEGWKGACWLWLLSHVLSRTVMTETGLRYFYYFRKEKKKKSSHDNV